jgi:hypothetical protein
MGMLEEGDAGVAGWVAGLGLPGIVDLHVHFMPDRVQAKVWARLEAGGVPVSTQLAAIAQLGLGDDWLRAVLWRNGVRLLGIAGPDW